MEPNEIPAYRLKASIKNNRLWRAVLDRWPDIKNQADASRRLNVSVQLFGGILNMKIFPYNFGNGKVGKGTKIGWSPVAIRIADTLFSTPEYLFDFELYGKAPNKIELEFMPPSAITAITSNNQLALDAPQENEMIRQELKRKIFDLLNSRLNPKHQALIRMAYGLDDGIERTSEEIAEELGYSIHSVRTLKFEIEKKIRKYAKFHKLDVQE